MVTFLLKATQNLKYQAVVINPEQLMKVDGGFEKLVKTSHFTDNLISVIFDEAHCISVWGAFCPEYKDVRHLCFMLPHHIPILITLVTLPPLVLDDVKSILQLRNDKLVIF